MAAVDVTTGQAPKRRETDTDALKRARILSVCAAEREDDVLLAPEPGEPMSRNELARWHLARAKRAR